MYRVTIGNMLHLYGKFGQKADFAVRLSVQMTEEVDGEALSHALERTQKRYPYYQVRMRRNEYEFYYEENPLPVVLLRTNEKISLNTEQTNYHVWAVCFCGDRIHLDFYHGITDGTGMYMVLATLLYYYCRERYGISDHAGILTLEDPVGPEENMDPQEVLSVIDPPAEKAAQAAKAAQAVQAAKAAQAEGSFQAGGYGSLTPSGQRVWDIEIPEETFMRFTSANDASPGTMISLLLARAIDSVFPGRKEDITNSYLVNARPMLGVQRTSHNCFCSAYLRFSDRVKAMPFDHQCTAYRGMTFIQSDEEHVVRALTGGAARARKAAAGAPLLEDKKRVFSEMLNSRGKGATFVVSYVGKWRFPAIGKYMREFWTHVSFPKGIIVQITAVNGKIFMSLSQSYEEDLIVRAFLRELEENNISYTVRRTMDNDNPGFPEPV